MKQQKWPRLDHRQNGRRRKRYSGDGFRSIRTRQVHHRAARSPGSLSVSRVEQVDRGGAMLTHRENESLTQIGPGTRAGNLMRHYWHPVAARAMLDRHPVHHVTLLGESLVLYRDKRGTLGLLGERCPHRGTSLAWGTIDNEGLRCAQHDWLFNSDGWCIDQPTEPAVSADSGEYRSTAYPVQELGGVVFAYLGPTPAPLLPHYNVLMWDDAIRETNGTVVPCNWLQVMENLLDPLHVECLHGRYFAYVLERKGGAQIKEFMALHHPAPMKKIGFDLFENGILERHVIGTEEDRSWRIGTPSFFPATSLIGGADKGGSVIFVVPLDDTHTWFLLLMAIRTGRPVFQESIPFVEVPGARENGGFILDTANGQDHMAVVTQGTTAHRDDEHLGTSDVGIVLYRQLLNEQMERMEGGQDPMNVRRDPTDHGIIDVPGGEQSLEPVDTRPWSRQRRRWAARHAEGQHGSRDREIDAQAQGTASPAPPPVVREHREVTLR
ncbi:MAG: Rieske 2Fe-2S domain-containing protein [Chloroflexi bacterium]|nr:Rieske 2Fe-2S domain-containing protein [Chloroflexota bacterium]